MPETPSNPDIPQIRDKRPRIAGLLPKNAQQRVLGGTALLMVLVIMFSGRKPSQRRPVTNPVAATTVVDPNQARIQEYRARLEEQARKLAAEEAQLAQTKQVLGLSAPGSGTAAAASRPGIPDSALPRPVPPTFPPEPQKTWQQLDREKREYQSLFASNVSLSYRRQAPDGTPGADTPAAPSATATSPSNPQSGAKERRLFEGTIIETVLTNRLDSSLSGPVNAMVTTDVYSHDRQTLLIPKGTRILGQVRKLESYGEQRLAVFFHRLIMPDGFSVSLDKFQGLNQIGETGLRDQVNHHYLQIFGVSLAIGAIAGAGQVATRYGATDSGLAAYQQGIASSLSQSAMHILDRYLNVLPTFTIREGHRIKVYLSQDLRLPAYDQHPAADL